MKLPLTYKLLFTYSLLILSCLFGCKKKQAEIPNMHLNYFGLIPGRYVIYDVKEIYHDVDLNPQHDTIKYQLKTVIGDVFLDDQGRSAREFKRYKRNNFTDSWVISDVWTALINNYKAELVEENQRIIKMVFAPTKEKNWNPNAFNSFDSTNYYYSNIHLPFSVNNLSFDSTVTVKQDYFFSLIDYRNQHETYAANVGLVSKTYKNLYISNFDTLNVQKGTEIHYQCIQFGFE
jgi:hypothetical protein